MRISGLASGIDTESIINDMMRAHRFPLNKITQKKQFVEWQVDDYRSVNKDVRSMWDNLFKMTQSSTYMAKTVNVSNENAVGIRALSASSEFSGTIEVERLAKAATWQTEAANKDLKEKSNFRELIESDTIAIKTPDGETKVFEIGEQESIKSVVDRLNKDSNVNVFFDERSGRLGMTAKNTGAGEIEVFIPADPEKPGEPGDPDNTWVEKSGGQPGQDAKFTLNGMDNMERSSNTFEINGFEITLKEVTNSPVTFNSAADVDKVFDTVKKFVDDYNDLIKNLNSKVRETRYRDYHPLSTEEKADMKEKEIELWEEKAKSGTLRNDSIIQSMLQNMRLALSSSVKEPKDSKSGIILADIGITTSNDHLANGMLEIDEKKLREVISTDPNKVYELLGRSGSDTNDPGLIHSVRTALKKGNDAISNRAGSSGAANESFPIGRNIKQMDEQIERFENRLKKMEERYYKQFTAMEQAMQRANSQAEQLMNALGGLMM
ncbi:hypothetical protein BI350_13740 [Sporosarcina ureilytica]|uniref:Flagellar hook-associated protein 2 n=2 Tax=Sporosarcina ureilytica TaxID=298596 RepID=A0A1D8JKN7_9BACL|nr:hypothetical protein BI350_13740 [Sporosarcina ureilytica]